ncbi:hypothetical protein ACIP2X_09170 [Streptomyces sp. NPDC089424]|uniref:hypothetical protein n=1 Tax=Streptomyces sp. NPDC089424 TaxID=3365917 RepID=UPI00380CD5C8
MASMTVSAWVQSLRVPAVTVSDQIRNCKKLGARGGRPRSSTRPTTVGATRSSAGGFNRLNRHRAVAARYDKLAVRCAATFTIAVIDEWL